MGLDPFSRLFDLNRDGKLNAVEGWLEYETFKSWSEKKHNRQYGICVENKEDEEEEAVSECPVCGDVLNDLLGNDETEEEWTCENCESHLHRDFEDDPYGVVDDDADSVISGQIVTVHYPNKRMEEAASRLRWLKTGNGHVPSDSALEEEIAQCEHILQPRELADRYWTAYDGFILAQAVKEHFALPIQIPDEDERVKTYIDDLVMELAEHDAALAAKVWVWCVRVFSPYKKYMDRASLLYNGILGYLEDYSIAFLDAVIEQLGADAEFRTALLTENPSEPDGLEQLVPRALETERIEEAKLIFAAAAAYPVTNSKNLEDMVQSVIGACKDWKTLENMEKLQLHILPLIRSLENKRIQRLLPQFEQEISEYISRMEETEDYQYSRRFEWRSHCTDGRRYGVDPLDYKTEEAYKAALYEVKYSWRRDFGEEARSYDLNVYDYETRAEYKAALYEARYGWRRKYAALAEEYDLTVTRYDTEEQFLRAVEQKKRQQEMAARHKDRASDDKTIYRFCGIQFPGSDRVYHYRTDDETITIGDRVIVPSGPRNEEVLADVVSLELHLRKTAPFPVEKAKFILRKI